MKVPDKAALLLIEIAGFLYAQYLMGSAAWIPLFSFFSVSVTVPSSQYVNGFLLSLGCIAAIILTGYSIVDPEFTGLKWILK